jgi:hypothetical protein
MRLDRRSHSPAFRADKTARLTTAAAHQFPEQQQAYSTSDASKRIVLSFSLSVLGLPQMKLEKMQ